MSRRAEAVLILLGVLLFCAPMFAEPLGIASGDAWRDNDWLNNRSFDLMSRQAIVEHGQFPLRAPGVGGGFPILGHPSDGSWAPTILPVLLLGDVLGVKVNLILLLLIGCWGVLGLARDHLGLPRGPALFAVGAFAFSGWFPSTMLVGFYQQAFLLLTPAILRLLLRPRLTSTLLAGFLLFLVLQQGGNALAVLLFFAVFFLLLAGRKERESGVLLGRLALAVGIAALLGVGKLVPLMDLMQEGTYAHADFSPAGQGVGPPPPDADFYNDLPSMMDGLLRRAPSLGRYVPYPAFGVPVQPRPHGLPVGEFGHVGFTPTLLLLSLLGVARGRGLALLGGWFLLICLGPHFVVDLHRFGPGSLPHLRGLSQPIKYYSFFFVLPGCLLAGLGFDLLLRKASKLPRAALIGLGLLLLLPPFASNRGAWADRFALPVRAEPGPFEQIAQIGDPSWAELPPDEIEARRARTLLREFARPPGASEYPNLLAGRGTIDWYGTLRLPEPSVPARFVLPDGSERLNPRYRGEAWVQGGQVRSLEVTPNRIRVEAEGPGLLVVNQRALEGFVVEGAVAVEGELLSADLEPGPQTVVFAYRPRGTRAALLGSALALLLWATALWRLSRPRASGSG